MGAAKYGRTIEMSESAKQRPKYLNLAEIRLPLAGIASIFHRISGAGMFLMLPVLVYLLQLSLGTSDEFAAFKRIVEFLPVKLVLLGLLWALLHHFCMGIRVLLLDIHIGIEKESANLSAKIVFAVSIFLTLIMGAKLW
jgi:succinate dehydrogenase / fumarate reductase cytochrome b subunit